MTVTEEDLAELAAFLARDEAPHCKKTLVLPGKVLNRINLTKTSICKAWKTGECDVCAHQCRFAHGTHELRSTPLFEVSGLTSQPVPDDNKSRVDELVRRLQVATPARSQVGPILGTQLVLPPPLLPAPALVQRYKALQFPAPLEPSSASYRDRLRAGGQGAFQRGLCAAKGLKGEWSSAQQPEMLAWNGNDCWSGSMSMAQHWYDLQSWNMQPTMSLADYQPPPHMHQQLLLPQTGVQHSEMAQSIQMPPMVQFDPASQLQESTVMPELCNKEVVAAKLKAADDRPRRKITNRKIAAQPKAAVDSQGSYEDACSDASFQSANDDDFDLPQDCGRGGGGGSASAPRLGGGGGGDALLFGFGEEDTDEVPERWNLKKEILADLPTCRCESGGPGDLERKGGLVTLRQLQQSQLLAESVPVPDSPSGSDSLS